MKLLRVIILIKIYYTVEMEAANNKAEGSKKYSSCEDPVTTGFIEYIFVNRMLVIHKTVNIVSNN